MTVLQVNFNRIIENIRERERESNKTVLLKVTDINEKTPFAHIPSR